MASAQTKQMNELYASIKERLSNPDIAVGFALVRHGGEERDVGQQRRDRRAYYESIVGNVSRVVDRRHGRGLE